MMCTPCSRTIAGINLGLNYKAVKMASAPQIGVLNIVNCKLWEIM